MQIKRKKIIALYNELKERKFPNIPEDDDLDEIYEELISLDLHYMGLASSYIHGNRIKRKDLAVQDNFSDMIKDINNNSVDFIQIKEYKLVLDELISLLGS